MRSIICEDEIGHKVGLHKINEYVKTKGQLAQIVLPKCDHRK